MKPSSSFLRRLALSYVDLSHARPWTVMVFWMVLAVVAGWNAMRLRIDTDLRVLLPQNTPSVLALEESEQRKGSTDLFTIAIQSPDLEALARLQADLAAQVSTWEDVSWVQHDQDRSFFEQNVLLYLPTSELENLSSRLSAMVNISFAEANPLLLDLGGGAPATLEGWPNESELRRQGLPPDIVTSLIERVRSQIQTDTVGRLDPEKLVEPSSPPIPDSLSARLVGWHAAQNQWVGVVLAQLDHPSTDAQYAQEVLSRGTSLIESLNPASYHPGTIARVAGAYRNFKEVEQVGTDMNLSITISLVLIVALLGWFVRRPASLMSLLLPLLVAMTWAMGLSQVLYGRLTLLTAFVLSLLAGLGIDYSIHLYARWIEEMRNGSDRRIAMRTAMVRTGRALLSSATTTIFCLLSLQLVHFTGFREFGVVVALGIAFAAISAWLVVPPLVFGLAQLADTVRGGRLSFLTVLFPDPARPTGGWILPHRIWSPRLVAGLALVGLVVSGLALLGPKPGFENDFSNLRGKSTDAGIAYGRAVGQGRNTAPTIILGSDEAQMRRVHETLIERYGQPADSMLSSFVTVSSFLPAPEVQDERLMIIEEIRELLDARALDNQPPDVKRQLDLLRSYLVEEPFGKEDLPVWAVRFLTERDGTFGTLGYIYASMRVSDALESAIFQDRFQYIVTPQGDSVLTASSGFIYADVVRSVKEDALDLAFWTLLLLSIVIIADLRSARGFLIIVGYVAATSLVTWGLMGWLGMRLGMFNMILIPTILSVTVDSVIHLYHRRLELGRGRLGELYHTTGSSVLFGALTNMWGFVGLNFVSHKGLQTIGNLATLGIGTSILLLLTVVPWVLERFCPDAPQKALEPQE